MEVGVFFSTQGVREGCLCGEMGVPARACLYAEQGVRDGEEGDVIFTKSKRPSCGYEFYDACIEEATPESTCTV